MTRTPLFFTILISKSRADCTRVSYYCNVDFSEGTGLNRVLSFACNAVTTRKLMLLGQTKDYFQSIKALGDYDLAHGRSLGYRVMTPVLDRLAIGEVAPNRRERVRIVMNSHRGLRALSIKYPWFCNMLEETVLGVLVLNKPVSSPLLRISAREATTMGKNITPALKARKTAEAGLYQW